MRRGRRCVLSVALVAACTVEEYKVDPRTGCEVCHRPRPGPGLDPEGIEDAHPFGDAKLACTDCHGGDPTSYDQLEAHVPPPASGAFVKNLTSRELDELDPAYLRFVNPSDLRVASVGCGGASPAAGGSGCHQALVDSVRRSLMGHAAGELAAARFRVGAEPDARARHGAVAIEDPSFDPSVPTAVPSLARFEPPAVVVDQLHALSSTLAADGPESLSLYAKVQDDYLAKSCFRCHLSDFGENRLPGDYRSSGCAACHMPYANDGRSHSQDPRIAKNTTPHPIRHALTSKIEEEQCNHCHYGGGRIGPSFLGYRESAGAGFETGLITPTGEALHGNDGTFYVADEDRRNFTDETPADAHLYEGMTCVDCHVGTDVHGDGRLRSDAPSSVAIECESCHGTIDAISDLRDARGERLERLERDAEGRVWLTTAIEGKRIEVRQVQRLVDPTSPEYSASAAKAMGRDASGFSHADRLECYTCHSAWAPSCYGCHVTMDYSQDGRVLTTGEQRSGRPSGDRMWVATDDLVLMWNSEGKIAPSMPAERLLLTVKDASGAAVTQARPRTKAGRDGRPSFGQRAFPPHTVQAKSPFAACDRCHIRADRQNEERVRQAVGLGTNRYIVQDDRGRNLRLDALVDDDGRALVDVGHDAPEASRPLEPELRRRLLEVPVP